MLGASPHFSEASLKCFQNQGHHHHYSHPHQELEIQKANVAELAWDRALTRGWLPPKNSSQGGLSFNLIIPKEGFMKVKELISWNGNVNFRFQDEF